MQVSVFIISTALLRFASMFVATCMQHPVSTWPVRFYRQRSSRVFRYKRPRAPDVQRGWFSILAHAKFHYLLKGIVARSISLLSAFTHVSHAQLFFRSRASLTSLSGDNILTSRSRYWFFISISKPLVAVIGTPFGVVIRVNPLSR